MREVRWCCSEDGDGLRLRCACACGVLGLGVYGAAQRAGSGCTGCRGGCTAAAATVTAAVRGTFLSISCASVHVTSLNLHRTHCAERARLHAPRPAHPCLPPRTVCSLPCHACRTRRISSWRAGTCVLHHHLSNCTEGHAGCTGGCTSCTGWLRKKGLLHRGCTGAAHGCTVCSRCVAICSRPRNGHNLP